MVVRGSDTYTIVGLCGLVCPPEPRYHISGSRTLSYALYIICTCHPAQHISVSPHLVVRRSILRYPTPICCAARRSPSALGLPGVRRIWQSGAFLHRCPPQVDMPPLAHGLYIVYAYKYITCTHHEKDNFCKGIHKI